MLNRKHKKFIIRLLPAFGCISTGIIYVAIGVIAILSFLKIKDGGADENSLMAFLDDYLTGKILIWLILFGTICYIIWRIFEAITNPYKYPKTWKGYGLRTGIGMSSIADLLIAYSAVVVLLGAENFREDGQPVLQREMVENLYREDWGNIVMIILGSIVLITAFIQFLYGVTSGYKERLDIAHFGPKFKKAIHFLAWTGYTARGIIIGIIGYYFFKSGITQDPQVVVNTDKAFNFIGDHVGHVYFIIVAAGTAFYGFFMFALGVTYEITD